MLETIYPTPQEMSALLLSLRVGAICAMLSAAPGIALGWLLARRRFPGKSLVDGVVHLPLVLPPVVVGYLLLIVLGRNRPIGRWLHDQAGIDLAFTWWAAVIASAVMGFPLLVRAVRLSIELIDPALERAAATLGASPARVFFTITIPLAAPGILTGLLLSFARSLGEFGATITFAGNIAGETRTLPLALYTFTQVEDGEAAALRLVVISILISFCALLGSEYLARRIQKGRTADAEV